MEIETNKYEKMMKQYPILFKQRTASEIETCMCWGIQADYGWYKPLNKLCSYLEELNNIYYDKYKIRIQADQVKSKYGELRFYYSIVDDMFIKKGKTSETRYFICNMLDDITDALIERCEKDCWNICEICGADGGFKGENLITTSGWISRICKKCATLNKK